MNVTTVTHSPPCRKPAHRTNRAPRRVTSFKLTLLLGTIAIAFATIFAIPSFAAASTAQPQLPGDDPQPLVAEPPDEMPGAEDSPATASPDAPPDAAPDAIESLAGEIAVRLTSFGVGNQARAGEWAGIRFELRDSASKQRNVIVRLAGIDADGDHPWYVRQITSNPGIWQGVWVYLRLPFAVEPVRDLKIEIYEAVEDDSPEARNGPTPGVRAGRLLARQAAVPRNPASLVDQGLGMVGVLGTAKFGLDRYSMQSPRGSYAALGHEADVIISGLKAAELPDRWIGLQQFSTLVWGDGQPSELRSERARAVREWVSRGGHLIILLPNVGETWTNRNSNELFDILPSVTVIRNESVDLEPYRAILSTDPLTPLPKSAVVYSLNPMPAASPSEAQRILNGPDGDCIVARRSVGAGAVTLVGLDLGRQQFASGRSIDPEIFWHRILGKRGRLPKSQDAGPQSLQATMRPITSMDQDIPGEIAKAGRSAAGVLLGLVVFAAYWLLAGPLGFVLLKRRAMTRHAWLAFLGVGAIFTLIAWGGATSIRPSKVEASHVTFLDHVYGQPVQRSRTFASVLIPRYGNAALQVGAPEESGADPLGRRTANLLAPWEGVQDRQSRTFPDSRGYGIDSRAPDTMTVPARATVKEVQADWAGGPRWRMPQPVNPDGTVGVIKVNTRAGDGPGESTLDGVLVHELPAPVEDVKVILILGQRPLPAPGRNVRPPEFTASGAIFVYGAPWPAGEPLDLGVLSKVVPTARAGVNLEQTLRAWIEKYDDSSMGMPGAASADPGRATERLASLALFSQLGVPSDVADNNRSPAVARRTMVHGWDLGRWFTQPCVIVLGTVGTPSAPAESPTPLLLDGEPVTMRGRTLIRWVYPLPDNPPAWRTADPTTIEVQPVVPKRLADEDPGSG